jgi:hypothetical protein
MSRPDVTDFEVCRTLIYQTVDLSLAKRNELLAKGKISKTAYIDRRKEIEEPLREHGKNLTIKIAEGIIEDFTHYKAHIEQGTTKLEQVSEKIQDVNKSINFFSEVVNFFGTILSTASLGLAGVPTLLDEFEKILERNS